MTTKEMASALNGAQYGNEVTRAEEQMAKENGLVIVYGYSDEYTEFCGAIEDEAGCFGGGTIFLTKDGVVLEGTPGAKSIETLWCCPETGASWSFRTDIPHETFNVYEDEDLFCVGIVFALADLSGGARSENDVLSAAIAKWGDQAQVMMVFEEMSELQKELCKNWRGKDNAEEIADEVADVEIMLAQLKMIYGIEDKVQKHREYKIARLARRLEVVK